MDRIRQIAKSSKWIHIISSLIYKAVNPNKDIVFTHPTFGSWVAYNFTTGQKQYYPYPEGVFKIAEKPNQRMTEKYRKEGFVEVEKGDKVIDIGAFVGEFTLGIIDIAGEVVSCEPTPETVLCLQKNTNSISNAKVIPAIIGSNCGLDELRIATDPTDNTTLDVDSESEDTGNRIYVPRLSIRQLIDHLNIGSVDFLKVEAEGAEPEILSDIESLPVEKIAVDASPERYGKSTVKEIHSILTSAGYEVEREGDIVFGLDKNY